MKTPTILTCFAASASLCLPLSAQETGRAIPAGLQALIPNDASALVFISPLDDMEEAVQGLLEIAMPEMAMMANLDALIAQANAEAPFDLNLIDRSKPIAIAIGALDPMSGAEPAIFVLIPTTDAAALQAGIPMPNIEVASRISGSYLAICENTYPATTGESKIATLLPSGLIAATLDVRPLAEAFGPMAGFMTAMGIGQAKTEVANAPDVPPALVEMATEILDATPKTVTGLIESLAGLQLAIDLDGSLLNLDASLVLKDGSLLSGFSNAEGATFGQLTHLIDQSAPISFGFGSDLGGMARWIRPYVDQIMSSVPVPSAEELPEGTNLGPFSSPQQALDAVRELTDGGLAALSNFGSGMVSSVNIVDGEPVSTFWFHGVNAESLAANLELVFNTELAGMAGLKLGTAKLGEATTELSITLDIDTLSKNFNLAEIEVSEIEAGFQQAFGDAIKLSLTNVGTDTLIVYNGDKEALLGALTAAKTATRGNSAAIARLGNALGGASPFGFAHINLGKLAYEAIPIIEQFEGPAPFPREMLEGIDMPLTLHRGMNATSWFGGLSLDLKDAGKLAGIAMMAARVVEQPESRPTPLEGTDAEHDHR